MKLTTFVTLSPKIHHTTFEKKWPCSFKDVKHVKFLTHDSAQQVTLITQNIHCNIPVKILT